MSILLVVNNPKKWHLDIPAVQVIAARQYITDPAYSRISGAKVYNLCSSYRYQSTGYYVSLLAEARGHKPIPDSSTIRDLQTPTITRVVSSEIDDLIQKSLAPIQGDKFTLSVYFGRNLAKRYEQLSLKLFNLFQAPLLRAQFSYRKKWHVKSISPIAFNEVPESHHPFIVEVANDYFAHKRRSIRRKTPPRYYMAILHNPQEESAPSNKRALQHFIKAAEELGIEAELITRDDLGRLPEYDALFIRETTAVNNHTFRFSRRAEAEGLVVIDDPQSILRCANKVYLAEMMQKHRIPTPKTLIVHKDNLSEVSRSLGLPCILKKPDSSFSMGVSKVQTAEELQETARKLLEDSELIIAQEFLPTAFDWRVGVLDGKALYVCKYFMARNHWQIVHWLSSGRKHEGDAETLAVDDAPQDIVDTAVRAAKLIGNGLYGVDLKKAAEKCYVIEVNDNPNIDVGVEDGVLKRDLYRQIMRSFLDRLDCRSQGKATL